MCSRLRDDDLNSGVVCCSVYIVASTESFLPQPKFLRTKTGKMEPIFMIASIPLAIVPKKII